MLENSWRNILSQGEYESELLGFTLSRAAGEVFRGAGRLRWTLDGGVRVIGTTDGDRQALALMSGKPGRIIPRSELLRLDATTPDGWAVEVTDILGTGHKAHLGRGVVWDFVAESLRLRQASSLVGKKPLLQAAINPIRRVKFQGESEIVNQNPHEYYRSTVRDWMAYETTFGSIYVRQAGETLGVQIESDLDHEGFENAIEAVRLAFGFIEGRSIRVLGSETHCDSVKTRVIYPKASVNENSFPSPLPHIWSGEPLARMATDFFFTDRGRTFLHFPRKPIGEQVAR